MRNKVIAIYQSEKAYKAFVKPTFPGVLGLPKLLQ